MMGGAEDVRSAAATTGVVQHVGLLWIVAEVVVLGWLTVRLDLEPLLFSRGIWWTMAGAVAVHHFLPPSQRPTLFFALSVFAMGYVFGATQSAWILVVGAAFFALCHLPVAIRVRAALLAVAMLALVAMRVGLLPSPWSPAVWPVLASMLMFRTIVYLRDVAEGKVERGDVGALGYFFLFPNFAFPLFPIVDYSTFRRRQYDRDAIAIYQRGVEIIARGMTHLIAYRLVLHYVVTPAEQVHDPLGLVTHLVGNFALVVRVSGQFHVVIGILHLFGFRLPRIMNLFFLATSFTDFWRRVNVYWKDFIQKLVFYPLYLRTRAWSEGRRLMLATIVAFVVTWFLHAYQWFWIQGRFLFSRADVVFWGGLGLLVLANTWIDARRGSRRVLRGQRWSAAEVVRNGLRAMATFTTIAVLWSAWVSESLTDWWSLWAAADLGVASVLGVLASAALVFVVATAVFTHPGMAEEDGSSAAPRSPSFLRGVVPALALVGIALLPRQGVLGLDEAVVANLRTTRLSTADSELLTRGYYEDLTDVARFNPELWALYSERRNAAAAAASRIRVHLAHNHWGMRDREYSLEAPPGTYRVALLGGSITYGEGVAVESTFDNLVEDRLNASPLPAGIRRVEILNFGQRAFSAAGQYAIARQKVFRFSPHTVIYVGHAADRNRTIEQIVRRELAGREQGVPIVKKLLRDLEITPATGRDEMTRRLRPHREEILSWLYGRIVELIRQHGADPVFVYVPVVSEAAALPVHYEWAEQTLQLAKAAGFRTIDLSRSFDGEEVRGLQIRRSDESHPNARGHRLIAGNLERELLMPHGLWPVERSQGILGNG